MSIKGAQSIQRALRVLHFLGVQDEQGASLKDVSQRVQLQRSTAHRILSSLSEAEFAYRDPETGNYRLGIRAMELGVNSFAKSPVVNKYRPVMMKLARITQDPVYLLVRQGDYAVCLERVDARPVPPLFRVRAGDLQPLGIYVGSIAMLAAGTDSEIVRIEERNGHALGAAGLTHQSLERTIERARRQGFADMMDIMTRGVTGVSATIPCFARPFAAIAIASSSARMTIQRRTEVGQLLVSALRETPPGR